MWILTFTVNSVYDAIKIQIKIFVLWVHGRRHIEQIDDRLLNRTQDRNTYQHAIWCRCCVDIDIQPYLVKISFFFFQIWITVKSYMIGQFKTLKTWLCEQGYTPTHTHTHTHAHTHTHTHPPPTPPHTHTPIPHPTHPHPTLHTPSLAHPATLQHKRQPLLPCHHSHKRNGYLENT